MTTLQELQAAVAQLGTDVAAEKAEVQGLLTDLKVQIQTLQDQIANGGVISQADLDALFQSVTAIDAGVKDISEPVVPTP